MRPFLRETFGAWCHFEVFDPDHDFDPLTESQVQSRLDINDITGGTLPDDNIEAATFSIPAGSPSPSFGGNLATSSIEFVSNDQTKSVEFQITGRQPGNNFIGVAYPHAQRISGIYFDADGVSLLASGHGLIDGANKTGIVTVWRTLHLERDTMKPPHILDDPFDVDDDPHPGTPAKPPWALFPAIFEQANVEVLDDLEPYETIKEKATFARDFGTDMTDPTTLQDAVELAQSIRNVNSEPTFWVIQLMYGYEFTTDTDFDGETLWIAGIGGQAGGDGPAYVFFETTRDIQANLPGVVPDYPELLERVSLHEAAHKFQMRHTDPDGIGNQGPLNTTAVLSGSGTDIVCTPGQLARIQGSERPR